MSEPTEIELTDAQWEKILPLLPPQKPWTGKPGKDLRLIFNALLWLSAHPDETWRSLPPRYGPWSTVANRYYRWRKAGIWEPLSDAIWEVMEESKLSGL